MSFDRCDVVYGADPFKGEDYARPWLVISNETHPFHGEQYVVLALTTRTWHDGLVEIADDEWIEGGTPRSSRVVPWSVETLDHGEVDHWQGTLESPVVR
jgi:mRNA-degrading endonuclease toxin of MazEF toxin-antitoxin module